MAQPYLSIIIPAYNEAERIPLTLTSMDKYLSGVDYSYEILVINDGSKDNTAEVVTKMAPMIKNLKLVDNVENKGKGGVVRQGMLMARGVIRLFTDADNSTSVDQFEKMIPQFKAGYGVVIGSRAVKGAKLDPPESILRRNPGMLGELFIQVLLLPGIWDTQCGFKAFSAEAVEKVFLKSKITGWGFDAEVLTLAKEMGYKIKEIPVRWVNDTRSHISATPYLKVLWETCKIRWWLWMGRYSLSANNESRPNI